MSQNAVQSALAGASFIQIAFGVWFTVVKWMKR